MSQLIGWPVPGPMLPPAADRVLAEATEAAVTAFRAGRPLEISPDLTRRWSGVVAATPRLGEELAAGIRG